MSKTATIKPVNGSAPDREEQHGVAVLRDREVKALVGLVCDAMSEARGVGHRLHTAIYTDDAAHDWTRLGREIVDALICLQATDHYLRMLRDVIAEQANGTADPWTAEPAF